MPTLNPVEARIAILRHGSRSLGIWVCLIAWGGKAHAQESQPPLTEAAAVRALSPAEAAKGLPVKLRGVVTFYDPVRRYAFIQDETAGIFFYPGASAVTGPLTFSAGEMIEIEGVSWPGSYAPTVESGGDQGLPVKVTRLGMGKLPEPWPLPWNALSDDSFHNRFVELRAVLRGMSVDKEAENLVLELSTRAGEVIAVIPRIDGGKKALPEAWIDMEVLLQGVFSGVANPQGQRSELRLFVQTLDLIKPEFLEIEDRFAEPARPFEALLRFDPASPGKRVRVEGVVTHAVPGRGVYLRDAGRGLWVESPQRKLPLPGDKASVIGFEEHSEGHAVLQDSILRRVESGPAPEPVTLTVNEARSGLHHADLIQIYGEVIEDSRRAGTGLIVIESEGQRFRAEMGRVGKSRERQDYKPKSWVRVSGICLNNALPHGAEAGTSVDFHIMLRSHVDIEILRAAPWWTPLRVVSIVGTLLALTAGTAIWGEMLRRRVGVQTAVIQHKLEREVIWEERNRIARELHDTLEQQLAAITIQLEATGALLPDSPEAARESLSTMRAMIQNSRGEARRSVWDLRSHTLEQRGLLASLQEIADPLLDGGKRQISVSATGAARRLDRQIEFHLLRVAQEAITNAVKHGEAAEVTIEIRYATDSVELLVRDNGRGFDPATPPANGAHFGLLGMRERAARLRGELRIESVPGEGTTISLTVGAPVFQPTQYNGNQSSIF